MLDAFVERDELQVCLILLHLDSCVSIFSTSLRIFTENSRFDIFYFDKLLFGIFQLCLLTTPML